MDVQLPDGTTVQGVPDGMSKADLFAKLQANGHPVSQDWLKPQPEPDAVIPPSGVTGVARDQEDAPRPEGGIGADLGYIYESFKRTYGTLTKSGSLAGGIHAAVGNLVGNEDMVQRGIREVKQAQLEAEVTHPEMGHGIGEKAFDAAAGVAVSAPAVAASVITGSVIPAAAAFGLQAGGEEVANVSARGGSRAEALGAGIGVGAVNAAAGAIPVGRFIERLGGANSLRKFVADAAVNSGLGAASSVVSSAIDAAVANPDMTFEQWAKTLPQQIQDAVIGGVVQTAAFGAAHKAASIVGGRATPEDQARQIQELLNGQTPTPAPQTLEGRQEAPEGVTTVEKLRAVAPEPGGIGIEPGAPTGPGKGALSDQEQSRLADLTSKAEGTRITIADQQAREAGRKDATVEVGEHAQFLTDAERNEWKNLRDRAAQSAAPESSPTGEVEPPSSVPNSGAATEQKGKTSKDLIEEARDRTSLELHGLGPEHGLDLTEVREALHKDPDAVQAAAEQHPEHGPGFMAEIRKINEPDTATDRQREPGAGGASDESRPAGEVQEPAVRRAAEETQPVEAGRDAVRDQQGGGTTDGGEHPQAGPEVQQSGSDRGGAAGADQGRPVDEYEPQREGETTKEYLKRVVDKKERPTELPEDHGAYFNLTPDTHTVSLDDLLSTKTESENKQGLENAPKRMEAAARGAVPRRDPITVRRRADGKFDVVDGNGTVTTAREFGWKKLPVRIEGEEGAPAKDANTHFTGVSLDRIIPKPIMDRVRKFLEQPKPEGPKPTPEQFVEGRKRIAPMIESAKRNLADYSDKLRAAASAVGGDAVIAKIKEEGRTIQKLWSDYKGDETGLKDLLRGSIVIHSSAEVPKAIEAIKAAFGKDAVVKLKDRFAKPTEEGYRDVLINVQMPDGHIAEVQIHTPETIASKDIGHHLYELRRDLDPKKDGDRIKELTAAQSDLYGAAKDAENQRLTDESTRAANSAGGTLSPKELTRAGGNGSLEPPQKFQQEPSGNRTAGTPSTSKKTEPGGTEASTSAPFIASPSEPIVASKPASDKAGKGQTSPKKSREKVDQLLAPVEERQRVGAHEDEIDRVFGDGTAKKLQDRGIVRIIPSDQSALGDKLDPRAQAMYIAARNGEPAHVEIYTDRADPHTSPSLMMHEVGEHYGLSRMLGFDKYAQLLKDLKDRAQTDPEIKKVWDTVKKNYTFPAGHEKSGQLMMAEGGQAFMREVAAHLVETGYDRGPIGKMMDGAKAFLYKNFGIGKVDAGVLRGLTRSALRSAANGSMKAVQPMGNAARMGSDEGPDWVGARNPTALYKGRLKTVAHEQEKPLLSDWETHQTEPDKVEQNVGVMSKYSNFKGLDGTPMSKAEQMINHMKDNLLWLHDQFSDQIRGRAKKWYDGANNISNRFAKRFDITTRQSAGMLAALSPKTRWDVNVSQMERIATALKKHMDRPWTPEMDANARAFVERSTNPKGRAFNQSLYDSVKGKTLRELEGNDLGQAMWIKSFDEEHNDRRFRLVTPEGGFADFAKTPKGGEEAVTAWGAGLKPMAKAISIFHDGSRSNISAQLGEMHKVRNFYHNIVDPNSPHGFLTADTHAMAAALLRPLGQSDLEVAHLFGSGQPGEPGPARSAATGIRGVYPLVQEAYRRAAVERQLLPREMQSISWEAVRGMYEAASKKGMKSEADRIWNEASAGKISPDQAREQLRALSGGVREPEWRGYGSEIHAGKRDSSYAGELSGDGQRPGREQRPGTVEHGASEPEELGNAARLKEEEKQTDTPAFKRWFGNSVVHGGRRFESVVPPKKPDVEAERKINDERYAKASSSDDEYGRSFAEKYYGKKAFDSFIQRMQDEYDSFHAAKNEAMKRREPRPMYHATTANDIESFRPGVERDGVAGAIFTAANPHDAIGVSEFKYGKNPEGLNVHKLYVRAENPWDPNNKQHVEALARHLEKNDPGIDKLPPYRDDDGQQMKSSLRDRLSMGDWQTIERPEAQKYIRGNHDGFYEREHNASDETLAVFDPKQLKSATGNKGTWDPEDGRISYSLKAPDTDEFKNWFGDSKAKDDEGNPIRVYRGEHGETDQEIQSRRGSISFGDKEAANAYAQTPNDLKLDGTAEHSRVIPAYLRIEKPWINDKTGDPFVDISHIAKTLGPEEAKRVALEHADIIQGTDNWQENFSGKYDSVADMVKRNPGEINKLYMDAYHLLDDKDFVKKLKDAGFDGAIHGGNGETAGGTEYKVFDKSQIKSAIGNSGAFDKNNPSILYSIPGQQQAPELAKKPGIFKRLWESNVGKQVRDWSEGIVQDYLSKVSPMVRGSERSMAMVKDFANHMREASWNYQRFHEILTKDFTPEQLKRMWEAGDEENDMRRTGAAEDPTKGLASLPKDQQDVMNFLTAHGEALMQRAKAAGMYEGSGVDYWVPRVAALIGEDGEVGHLTEFGNRGTGPGGLTTKSSNLTGRKHLTTAEAEEALKAKFGTGAGFIKDIRTMPIAMARLEKAIAGRELVNRIQELSQDLAMDPREFVTFDHPALKSYRAEEDEKGKLNWTVRQRMIPKEFEGPLKAVLTQPSGKIYKALLAMKNGATTAIMWSPFIHLGVEVGRAFPVMGLKMLPGTGFWKSGRAMLQDPEKMQKFIRAGYVPIGRQGMYEDITSIGREPDLEKGRGLLAKGIGGAVGLVNKGAGEAIKGGIDRAGDFVHGTLLWDRVAELQAGIANEIYNRMMKDGHSDRASALVAAHIANRYAGALPPESISAMGRKVANVMMFSRSFTLGNLGAMKDAISGLPRDIKSQLRQELNQEEAGKAISFAAHKARAGVAVDIALMYGLNAMLQVGIGAIRDNKDKDRAWYDTQGLGDQWEKYTNLLHESTQQVFDHPIHTVLNPLSWPDTIKSFLPQGENEEGKRDRFLMGHDEDGTAVYGRTPFGKIGEEMEGWLTKPGTMLKNKMSTLAKPVTEAFANQDNFGRRIYRPDDDLATAGAKIAKHFIQAQLPMREIEALHNMLTGNGKTLDASTIAGPLIPPPLTVTTSKGYPGGEAMGAMHSDQTSHQMDVQEARPDIIKAIKQGDTEKAEKLMDENNIYGKERQMMYRAANTVGLSKSQQKKFWRGATEAERSHLQSVQERSQY